MKMSNLFSTFDPTTEIINLPINWTSTAMGLLLIPTSIWLIPSRNTMTLKLLMDSLHKEMKTITGTENNKGNSLIFISLFTMILMNNFLRLFPYVFTKTSHLVLTLTGAFGAMVTLMGMIKWFHQYNDTLLGVGAAITILTMIQWWDITREWT